MAHCVGVSRLIQAQLQALLTAGSAVKRKREAEAAAPPRDDDSTDDDEVDTAPEDRELKQEDIDRLVEQGARAEIAALDEPAVATLVLNLEKKINKNLKQRTEHADDPEKFIGSEIELDEHIRSMQILTTAPNLYPALIKHNAVRSLLQLLTHENADVAVTAVNLWNELFDAEDTEDPEPFVTLVQAFVDANGLKLLVENLTRLRETEEPEAEGVYSTLSAIESMVELVPPVAKAIVAQTPILTWLLRRLKASSRLDQNGMYASEILSILVQNEEANQIAVGQLTVDTSNGLDILLQVLAPWRHRDPHDSDEEEFLENLFDSLCSLLMVESNRTLFRRSEGFELMVRMIQGKHYSRLAAVRVIDFALTNCPSNCMRLVDIGGLKTVFPVLLARGRNKLLKTHGNHAGAQEDEHTISIIASLFAHLETQSIHEKRLVSKFIEADFEKLTRLVELFAKYHAQVNAVQTKGPVARDDEVGAAGTTAKEHQYLQLLDAGLFSLQRIAYCIGCLNVLGDELQAQIERKLAECHVSPASVAAILDDYASHMGISATEGSGAANSSMATELSRLAARIRERFIHK